MSYVDNEGVRIYYEERGEGPAILLTHGYGATLRMWNLQIDALVNNYHIITWDMRGHGLTDSPENPSAYSHEGTIADMTAVLDVCGITQAVIAGLSLGGFMSLAFHLAHRDRVRALMLFDTGPGYKKDSSREHWNNYSENMARSLESQGLAALGTSLEVNIMEHRSVQGLVYAARGMLIQKDDKVINSLPHIQVPTLVLAGSNDIPFLAGTDYMVATIPHARKVIIDDTGHVPNIEKPEVFNKVVLSFLEEMADQ